LKQAKAAAFAYAIARFSEEQTLCGYLQDIVPEPQFFRNFGYSAEI